MKPFSSKCKVRFILPVFILFITVMMVTAPAAKADTYFSGSGTEEDPYQITSAADLSQLATLVNDGNTDYSSAYYIQTQDIDLSGYPNWTPIGANDSTKLFYGSYDGDGYKIKDLSIDLNSNGVICTGLFGYVQGTVKNVNLEDGNVNVVSSSSTVYAGSLIGWLNNGNVQNCNCSVNVTASSTTSTVDIGGIIGYVSSTDIIANCKNTGCVKGIGYYVRSGGISGCMWTKNQVLYCMNSGDIHSQSTFASTVGGITAVSSPAAGESQSIENCSNSGSIYLEGTSSIADEGGIVGAPTRTDIMNCFNAGNIISSINNKDSGGIIGHGNFDTQSFRNCYNVGLINSNGSTGGIAGRLVWISTSNISNCYYMNICPTGIGSGTGTTYSKTINEMKQQSTYSGFDFDTVWTMNEADETGYDFPQLQGGLFYPEPHEVALETDSEAGTADGSGSYNFMDTVTITATPKEGYTFSKWTVVSGGAILSSSTSATTTFSMPLSDVSITAVFEKVKYNVTVQSDEHGTATGSGSYAWGYAVSLNATANSGYEFMYWEVVTGEAAIVDELDMTTTLTMPQSDVTIKAHFAANPTGYSYTVSNEKATITKYTGSGGNITIPYKLGGYRVTAIGDSVFEEKSSLTGITIPDTIISIGKASFYDCSGIISLDLGHGVQNINDSAFAFCTGITTLIIPDSVINIGSGSFYGLNKISSLNLGSGVQNIGGSAFEGCTKLTTINIPDGVANIGVAAFDLSPILTYINVSAGNTSFKSIDNVLFNYSGTDILCYPASKLGEYTIPEGVTTIRDYAFYCCTLLTSINIPDSVTNIGQNAFYGCTGLTDLSIPGSVSNIGYYAFGECSNITKLTLANGIKEVGSFAFYKLNIATVDIPQSVVSIGDCAFGYCGNLASAYFRGSKPVSYGNSVFEYNGTNFKLYYHVKYAASWQGYSGTQAFCVLTKDYQDGWTSDTSITMLNNFRLPVISDPDRNGYDFKGWYKEKECHNQYNFNDIVTNDITLYAKWTPKTYTIIYDLAEGSLSTSNPAEYNIESPSFTLYNPARPMYKFTGWTGTNGSVPAQKITINKGSYGDRSYIANWARIYTIRFNAGSGAKVSTSSKQVLYGEYYGELPIPTRSGYYFKGWYTGTNGAGALVESDDTVSLTADTTLYAKWVKSSSVALKTPSLLSVKTTDYKSITLKWKAVSNAKGYEVYKKIGSTYSYLATVDDALSYTETGLKTGTKYYYEVRAYWTPYQVKVYSKFSSAKSATPSWPSVSFSVSTPMYTSVDIKWNPVAGATKYDVLRCDTSYKGEYKVIASRIPTDDLKYTDAGLTCGSTYYYKIKVYGDPSETYFSFSGYKSIKPAWPTINLTAGSNGYNSVKLTWNDINGADSYEVYRGTSSSKVNTKLGTVPKGTEASLSYIDSDGLTAGKTYYYKIMPLDSINGKQGPYCSYKSAKPVPSSPIDLTPAPSGGTPKSITVSWSAVDGATGYEVYRATSSKGKYTKIKTTDSLSFDDTNRTVGKTYYYKVRAYTLVGSTKIYGGYSEIKNLKVTA